MRDRKILLIIPYGSVGGMERLALNFYNFYKKKGYFIKVLKFIKLDSDIIKFGDDELYLKSKDFHEMSKSERLLFYFNASVRIRKIIKKELISHSIAFGDMANIFSSVTFTKEFKVGSVHALKSVELSSPTLFNRLTRLGYRSTYKKLNKLVCISKAIKVDLIENCDYRFDNLEVIYNPHNIEDIISLSKEALDNEKEQELFRENCILFLGRLSVQKAPWHLVRAFKNVVKEYPKTQLIFIGDGDTKVRNYLDKQINQFELSNHIHFLGRRGNPYKYMIRATCLALSSYYEGTPNVIVEAMATGTPVVSSFCTRGLLELMSTNEELEYDNENLLKLEGGFITPSFYKGSLNVPKQVVNQITKEEILFAEALKEVLKKSQEAKSKIYSQNELLKKFDLPEVAKQYLEN